MANPRKSKYGVRKARTVYGELGWVVFSRDSGAAVTGVYLTKKLAEGHRVRYWERGAFRNPHPYRGSTGRRRKMNSAALAAVLIPERWKTAMVRRLRNGKVQIKIGRSR
jgi:hypothetical protein